MPRVKNKLSKKRLKLEVPERIAERLADLKAETESDSMSEVIRKSLAVYDHLWTKRLEDDAKIVIKYPDGTEETLVLL